MAVEKLILRSILYGADKIPDTWFEKLPGGYYKDAQGNTHKIGEKNDKMNDKKRGKPSQREGRKAEYNDFYPERHTSESGRQRRKDRGRSRSSYDGGADDDYYYDSGDGRPHRSKSHRRRRSLDGDRYAYDDGHRRGRRDNRERRPREQYRDDRHRGAPSPSSRDFDYGRRRSAVYIDRPPTRGDRGQFGPSSYATTEAVETRRAAAEPPYPRRKHSTQMPSQPTPPPVPNGGISNGYIPYAHIYGNASPQYSPYSGSPTPPFHDTTRFAPRSRASPVHPSSRGYHQATTASDFRADATYTREPGIIPQNARSINRYGLEESNGYDESGYPPFGTHPLSRQRGSPPFDSYEAHGDERRSHGERRNGGPRTKLERDIDSQTPLRAQTSKQKPTSNVRNEGERRSVYDRNGLSGRATAKGRRDDEYYSEQYSGDG